MRHRQEEQSVRLTRGDCPYDVRVIQRRGQGGLAREALPEPLVLGQSRSHDLERNPLARARVLGQVDAAHRAGTDQRLHAEAGDDRVGDDASWHWLPQSSRGGIRRARLVVSTLQRPRAG
jgi:hypothetical protein